LWKNYNEKNEQLEPPTFGLNFLKEDKPSNREFMLLCGFERFDRFYVRIDILERLFRMIFNSKNENNDTEIKLIPDMLNLLGCSKVNFIKLLNKMNYKTFEKEKDLYFKYLPSKKVFKNKNVNEEIKDNPFQILKQLNLD
jgi:ATP-dependent RNA helicase SUPV3L1/SUV3